MSLKLYSNNEWSPLREVILGSPLNYKLPNFDLSFKIFFKENLHSAYSSVDKNKKFLISPKFLKELGEDINEMQKIYESMGIKVHRPKILEGVRQFKTPYFSSTMIPALNVRDQVLILGNTIIELSPQVRCRYFENDLLKPIFYEFFKRGDCNWISMPKAMMLESSFDTDNESNTFPTNNDLLFPNIDLQFDMGHEMMIDAAQFIRFGKDIIVNVSNNNHRLGLEWMIRQFPDYKFHVLRSVTDNHLDSYIVPLTEGVVLVRNGYAKSILPKFLRKWKVIESPLPHKMGDTYKKEDIQLASPNIDINVLSIDGKRIVCNSLFPELIDLLYKHKFEPVPIQHRHGRLFAGGFHCLSLDVVRGE